MKILPIGKVEFRSCPFEGDITRNIPWRFLQLLQACLDNMVISFQHFINTVFVKLWEKAAGAFLYCLLYGWLPVLALKSTKVESFPQAQSNDIKKIWITQALDPALYLSTGRGFRGRAVCWACLWTLTLHSSNSTS